MGLIRPKACRKPNSLPGRAWGVRALDSLGAQRAPRFDFNAVHALEIRPQGGSPKGMACIAWTPKDHFATRGAGHG